MAVARLRSRLSRRSVFRAPPQLDAADADREPATRTEFERLDDLLDGGVQRDDGAVVEAQPHVVHPLPVTEGVDDGAPSQRPHERSRRPAFTHPATVTHPGEVAVSRRSRATTALSRILAGFENAPWPELIVGLEALHRSLAIGLRGEAVAPGGLKAPVAGQLGDQHQVRTAADQLCQAGVAQRVGR